MSGVLYIVATPIGNLEDITLRALRVLREADAILAEDTRVTKKLLTRYEITKEIISFHEHSRLTKIDLILEKLKEGKNLALVTDAGTPGIADPGQKLIHYILKNIGAFTRIVPIPGSNAAIAALSVSGFHTDQFTFLGFPPHKKGRETFFKDIALRKEVVVFYESPHRISKAVEQMQKFIPQDREVMVGREITKMFESFYRGTVGTLDQLIPPKERKGEFVVVLERTG